ncbi:TraR/DksA family transcriptional regulator [Roseateles oligotrophus]|uniref:TraR/DksA family transcriptional regulator n=1 Tax=Roseateles oligotrophus TaxID=1769250 RepID=A0ABT2YCH3_9BURK|nr:TraR/DksA family transcriptional regulator [Roseateles oligotrophus]MCV2367745.1 TraR/DksA family transcriptional regulator [Roseateles oligotrophus]
MRHQQAQVLTPGQQAMLEDTLLQRQRSLEHELQTQLGAQGRVEHAREQLLQDADGEQAHATDREVDLARSDANLEALRQVNEALQRLRSPEFGLCSNCGEAIAFDRLKANPEALRCITCQAAEERLHGGTSHKL